jgi:hypothetical protein
MNKTLTIVIAIMLSMLLVASAFGAEKGTMKKGSWFMEGGWTAGFSSQGGDLHKNANGDSYTAMNFSPCAGFFFMDGLGIGALIDFSSTKQGDDKSTYLAFGPKAYYYIGAASNDIEKGKLVPYITASFTMGSETFKSKNLLDEEAESKEKGTDINFGLGGVYMLEKSLGVSAEVSYTIQSRKWKTSKPVDTDWSDSVSGSVLGIGIGVKGFFSFGD